VKSLEDFGRSAEMFAKRAEAFRLATDVEHRLAAKAKASAALVLVGGVTIAWVRDGLTAKSLVVIALVAFIVKKLGDIRRNLWCDRKIKEIKELYPS
jgi:hypothetical protein